MSSLERVRGVESGAAEVDRDAEEFKSSIVPWFERLFKPVLNTPDRFQALHYSLS